MTLARGDVVLAWFPFASGVGGKRRPCLVMQNDEDNRKLANTIIAQVTSNLARTGDKSHVRTTSQHRAGSRRSVTRKRGAGSTPARATSSPPALPPPQAPLATVPAGG